MLCQFKPKPPYFFFNQHLTTPIHIRKHINQIAKAESDGKVEVQKIRAANEGLFGVVEVVKFCADEKNAKTSGCKNLDKLLAVKAGS